MTIRTKRKLAAFASSVFLAASPLAANPAPAPGGGGSAENNYPGCYDITGGTPQCCQLPYYDITGGNYDPCCEYYLSTGGPLPPRCEPIYYYEPTEDPSDRPSQEPEGR
jgi:hypothetical protein